MTTKDSLRPGAVALALVSIMLAALASVAWAGREAPTRSLCKSTLVRGVVHLCGPATAKLSAFPGVTFRNGTCKRTVVAGEPNLTLELGELTQNAKTNNGRRYLRVSISGPLSRPTSGYVIAYANSKRWSGIGESFKGNAQGGTFVVRGSRGEARGSFACKR